MHALLQVVVALTIYPVAVQAAPPAVSQKAPSAPPTLSRKAPSERPRCQRQFLYQGKLVPCDSQLAADGENLRPLLDGIPEAVSELDTYQRTRRRIQNLAYVGTAGVLIATTGYFISRGMEFPQSIAVRNFTVIPGLLLLFGSAIYGYVSLQDNEEHLNNAVNIHNQARPGSPIELQFSTQINF